MQSGKQRGNKVKSIARFMHDMLGWASPSGEVELSGINMAAKCKHCGGGILLDSQGNWFHVDALSLAAKAGYGKE